MKIRDETITDFQQLLSVCTTSKYYQTKSDIQQYLIYLESTPLTFIRVVSWISSTSHTHKTNHLRRILAD